MSPGIGLLRLKSFFYSRCIPEFLARGNKIKKDFFSISFFRAIRGWNTWAFPFYIASVCPHNGKEKKNGKGKKDVGSNQFLRPIHISFTASAYQKVLKKYLNIKYVLPYIFVCLGIRVSANYIFSPTLNPLLLFPVLFPKGKKKR